MLVLIGYGNWRVGLVNVRADFQSFVLFCVWLEFYQRTKVRKGMKLSLYMLESFPKLFVMNRPVWSRSMFMVSRVYSMSLVVE